MQKIKKITAKEMSDLTPYIIEKPFEVMTLYYLKHYSDLTQIQKLEQTAKGVYLTLWICRKEVRLFLSNRDIDIEYED